MIVYQWALPCCGQSESLSIHIRNSSFNNVVGPVNQRIGKRKNNGVGGKRDGLTIRQVLEGNLSKRSILSTLISQDKCDGSIGMCWCRAGCRQEFVATDIFNLYVVGVIAVEIPQIFSICHIFCSIDSIVGLCNHRATIVIKVLSIGILEVKGTGAAKFYKLACQIRCRIGHIDVGTSRWRLRDTVLYVKFIGIEDALHGVELYRRLIRDVRTLKAYRDRAIATQRCTCRLLDGTTADGNIM